MQSNVNPWGYVQSVGFSALLKIEVSDDSDNVKLKVSPEKLIKNLKVVDGKPLYYKINGDTDFEYLPYFEVQYESFTCFP